MSGAKADKRLSPEGEVLRKELEAAAARLHDRLMAVEGVEGVDVWGWPAARSKNGEGFSETVKIHVRFGDWDQLAQHAAEVENLVGDLPLQCYAPDDPEDPEEPGEAGEAREAREAGRRLTLRPSR